MNPQRVPPGPGQESVWDYPRPPKVEATNRLIRVELAGQVIAESRRAFRILETSHPPVYYIPPEDVHMEFLERSSRSSFCEWKGQAVYFTLAVAGRRSLDAAWSYPTPSAPCAAIAGYLAFYPGRVDACSVDGERVRVQDGDFYGGWITSDIVGPFKGGPATGGW